LRLVLVWLRHELESARHTEMQTQPTAVIDIRQRPAERR
jgi:hypothetical protein